RSAAGGALRCWQGTVLGGGPGVPGRLRLRPLAAALEPTGIAVEVPGRVELVLPGDASGAAEVPGAFLWRGWGLHLAATEPDAPVEHRRVGAGPVRGASGWPAPGVR